MNLTAAQHLDLELVELWQRHLAGLGPLQHQIVTNSEGNLWQIAVAWRYRGLRMITILEQRTDMHTLINLLRGL